jgi:thymidylate synthase (FAD)
MITVGEKVPIFVARQRFKHTVGFTYNEMSRRYVDDAPEFFIPDVWRSRPDGSMKQGSGTEEIKWLSYDDEGPNEEQISVDIDIKESYKYFLQDCEDLYHKMIECGVAPEQARMVLPQSMYTEYFSTGSLAAYARAYKLRIDPHAQLEIQFLAKRWDEIIRPLFPVSWSALVD